MDPYSFHQRSVTMDETWVHYFQPEMKQLKHLGSPPSKEAKTGMSTSKLTASIFWDAEGVLLVNYLDKDHTSLEPTLLIFWDSCGGKSSRFGMESWQEECSSTRTMHSGRGCYPAMWIPSCWRPTPFSWFGSLRLLPLTENEKGARWSSFCHRWWCVEWCEPCSEGQKWPLLHRRDLSAPWPLNSMC